MTKIINPQLEAINLLLEAADLVREGKTIEASTLAGISANLSEYGSLPVDLEEEYEAVSDD